VLRMNIWIYSVPSALAHVIEGVVGFAVVRQGGAYCSTVKYPGIMLERLTKEVEKWGNGPVSLLESTSVAFSFSKNLTRKYRGTEFNCAQPSIPGSSAYRATVARKT
jgi:hypothetical protein